MSGVRDWARFGWWAAFWLTACGEDFSATPSPIDGLPDAGAGGSSQSDARGPSDTSFASERGTGDSPSMSGDAGNDGGCSCPPDQECVDGGCVPSCPTGQTRCGTCVDTRIDAKHCGSCTVACDPSMECADSKCVVPCKASLRQPITDLWGVVWDGLERAIDTRANAEMACAMGGARLPLATELHRVSATQSATVGQTNHTNYLWSRTPSDAGHTISVRLSDASTVVSDSSAAGKLNFRCVCEPPLPATFAGAACNGPPGAGCFALPSDGMRYNIDAADRAPLPKGSAIWECQQAHAHLADYNTYIEAIQSRLPRGSGAWVHTADDSTYTSDTVIKWKDEGTAWVALGNTTFDAMTTAHSFRCAGLNYAPGASSVRPANEFVEAPSGYKSSGADEAPVAFAAAHDVCFYQGGHIARSTELGHLITAGLPGGMSKGIWTADAAGFGPASQFLTIAISWKDKLPIFPYAYTNSVTGGVGWLYKSDPAYGFRCVFYPVDEQYSAPADNNCNGGCLELRVGNGPSTMWFDKLDRGAATLEGAIAGCRAKGAHLPSERDFVEAIRNGLPSGSNAWLLTWDVGYGSPGAGPNASVVRWMGEDRKFTDLYPTYMSWFGLGGTTPYRCMWTNELR